MDFASDRGVGPQPNQEIRRRARNEEPARKTRVQARMTSSMGSYPTSTESMEIDPSTTLSVSNATDSPCRRSAST